MNLIEQLNDLCTEYEGGALALSVVTDLRAIIEQAKREAAEPVAVPDHTKLIGELVEALDVLSDFASTVGGSSSFWDEVWPKHDESLGKARGAIK